MTDNLTEALIVLVVGMLGVFASLFFFYLLMTVLNKADNWINGIRVKKVLSPSADDKGMDKISPEMVAAISAAVYEAFKKPVVIKKIKFLNESQAASWVSDGRIGIMGSHNISKR